MIWAKINTITSIVENMFEYEGESLPEVYGNPLHYVKVEEGMTPIIGGTFKDGEFLPPKPYPSWGLDNGSWVAPVQEPSDFSFETNRYIWNEETTSWQLIE